MWFFLLLLFLINLAILFIFYKKFNEEKEYLRYRLQRLEEDVRKLTSKQPPRRAPEQPDTGLMTSAASRDHLQIVEEQPLTSIPQKPKAGPPPFVPDFKEEKPSPAWSAAKKTTPPPRPVQPAAVKSSDAIPPDIPSSPPIRPGATPGPAEPRPTLEAIIGGKWSLRIGLLLIAIGAAFFARLISPKLGPAAKVALAYAGAWALFTVGRYFEQRLRDFARPVMAGGLALGFFVAFTSHFVPAMRCLPLSGALAWMLASVILILLFAEYWDSQATAGLAIFLGSASALVAAGDADAFSLSVLVFLSLTAIALFIRHNWLPLSLFTLALAYSGHMLWVLVERVETPPQQAFWINLSFLTTYYVIFLASDLIWWKRLQQKGESAFSKNQRLIGTILGPINLILYISLASFFYVATKIYIDDIYWFFFIVAFVQGIVALTHKSFGDKDHSFYFAVGTILVVIGSFSAFDALSLNLVLAAEAIILLITAHLTRIWVFHLLAQLVLALNFGHYWFYTWGEPSTTPYFIGGILTAGVYFLKSSLEELWYGREARIEWLGGEKGGLSKWFIERFDRVYSPIAPYLAHIHAAGGALILLNQCARYFSAPVATEVLSVLLIGITLAGLLRRSFPLLVGYLSLQLSFLFFWKMLFPDYGTLLLWQEIISVTASLLAVNLIVRFTPMSMETSEKRLAGTVIGYAGMWGGILIALICIRNTDVSRSFYLPWIGVIGLIYFTVDRWDAVFRQASVERSSSRDDFAFFFSSAASVAASLLVFLITRESFAGESAIPVLLIASSMLVIAAGGLRRNGGLYLGGLVILFSCYLFLLAKSYYTIKIMQHSPIAVSLWIALGTIAISGAHDRVLSVRRDTVASWFGYILEIVAYVIYAMGFLFLIQFLQQRVSFPWSVPLISLSALILYSIVRPFDMRVGALVAYGLVLAAQGIIFSRLFFESSPAVDSIGSSWLTRWILVPAAVVFLEAVLYERLLALAKTFEVSPIFRNIFSGGPEVKAGSDASKAARSVVVVAATIVMVLTIYRTASLSRWVTAGWSLLGVILVMLGFLWKSPSYRRTALALFALCIARVFLVDTRHLSDIYKMLAFMILGLSLVGMGWLYSRFASEIKRWL